MTREEYGIIKAALEKRRTWILEMIRVNPDDARFKHYLDLMDIMEFDLREGVFFYMPKEVNSARNWKDRNKTDI